MLRLYKEPAAVNVGLYAYHALVAASGLSSFVSPQPIGWGHPDKLDDWADWVWLLVFAILGLAGVAVRTASWIDKDAWHWTMVEGYIMATGGLVMAGVALGELFAVPHPVLTLGFRFGATAALGLVAGMTEIAYTRQRVELVGREAQRGADYAWGRVAEIEHRQDVRSPP